MDMTSLFPSDSVGNAQPTPHASFRAGILQRNATTNQVTADPRRGTFQITTSPEDQLMHLQWRPRNPPTVEQDLILFNGETEMKQVTSCPPAARVYVLKWKEADTRLFFWMQGTDATQDATNIAAVNNVLENGPDSQQPVPAQLADVPATTSAPRHSDVVMTTPEPSTPPAQETPAASNTAPEPAPAPAPPSAPAQAPLNQITLDQMREALSSIRGSQEAQREVMLRTPALPDLLSMELLQPILEKPRVQEMLPSLLEHLPEQDRSMEGLIASLRSPPVRSQAVTIYRALLSSGARDLLHSFGLDDGENRLAPIFGPQAFLDSLSKLQKDKKGDD